MLAQDWLSGINRIASDYDGWVEERLRLPHRFDPSATPSILANIAERIVFTDDVPSLLYEMHRNKQITYEGMFTSARLPFDCFWIEYKSAIGIGGDVGVKLAHYGAMVQRHQERVRMAVVVGFDVPDLKHPVCAISHAIEFMEWPIKIIPSKKTPSGKAVQFHVVWKLEKIEFEGADTTLILECPESEGLAAIMAELIFGIFLVTQPKVYNEEVVKWDERKQLARVRDGKKPLLEYRRINLRICKDAKRYTYANGKPQRSAVTLIGETDTESDAAIRHRRYHKVMGHFRHYLNHEPPRTVWIEQHYRGDPSLGVIFTERDVTK